MAVVLYFRGMELRCRRVDGLGGGKLITHHDCDEERNNVYFPTSKFLFPASLLYESASSPGWFANNCGESVVAGAGHQRVDLCTGR